MPLDPAKAAALKALDFAGEKMQVCEVLEVIWDADDPTETRYYGVSAFHETPPFETIPTGPVEARIIGNPFKEFEVNPDLRTETIRIAFDDIDGDIRSRFRTFGSGVRCEVFLWYPQVDLLHSLWFGQLQAPQIYGWKRTETVATNGFRSREQTIPKRTRPKECTSNFGGRLSSAEAVRTNLCPYNRHLGGSVGLLNGGDPFEDCPRLAKQDCIDRFGHADFFGGFTVDASAVVTDQRTGYIATSRGNVSKLKEPIRVIAGSKYMRSLPLLLWRREENQSNQDRGLVATVWEVGEGPVKNIRNIKVNDLLIQPLHLAIRNGTRGQLRTHYAPDVSNFSSTAHFFARYGWVDPRTIGAADLRAECVVDGFREVTTYNTVEPGQGLIQEFFEGQGYDPGNKIAERVDTNIDYPLRYGQPIADLGFDNFSIKWSGTITFPYSETFTLSCEHDDIARLVVNGSELFNATTLGTSSNTFAATADTPYSFVLEFKQSAGAGANPWKCIVRWQSTSQALSVIPASAFAHTGGEGFVKVWSDDRVWWVFELLSNQKFGMAYPYGRFTTQRWREVADWGRQNIHFGVTFPDGEERNYPHRRTRFEAIIEGRPIAEQIVDICRSGGISVPYQHEGKFEIAAFRAFSQVELDNAPVFRDRGENKNILWRDGEPAIELSETPNDKITNEVTLVFEEAANLDTERPVTVDDPDQKLKAGRALGEDNLKDVPKRFSGFGIRELAEAIKAAYRILWFGEFDEGGTQNALKLKIEVPYVQAIDVKRYQCIKVETELLDGFTTPQNEAWEYFRVLKLERTSRDTMRITAVGYNKDVYESFEILDNGGGEPGPIEPPPFPPVEIPPEPGPNPNPLPQEPPQSLQFTSLTYDAAKGYLSVEVST